MELGHTRSIVRAILTDELTGMKMNPDPIFGLFIPDRVGDVPSKVLNPRNTWADKDVYDIKAMELAQKFKVNFENFADKASDAVKAAGPNI